MLEQLAKMFGLGGAGGGSPLDLLSTKSAMSPSSPFNTIGLLQRLMGGQGGGAQQPGGRMPAQQPGGRMPPPGSGIPDLRQPTHGMALRPIPAPAGRMPGGAMLGALPPEVMEKIKAMLGGLQPGGQPMGMMKRPMQTSMPADPGAGAPNVTNAAPNVTSVAKNVMPPPSPAQNPWLEQLLKSLQRPPVPAQPPAGPMPGYPYQPNPIGQWGARRDI